MHHCHLSDCYKALRQDLRMYAILANGTTEKKVVPMETMDLQYMHYYNDSNAARNTASAWPQVAPSCRAADISNK